MKCEQCQTDAYMGFTCTRCGKYFCVKDRLPEKHHCAFQESKNNETQLRLQQEYGAITTLDRSPSNTIFKERENLKDNSQPRGFDDDEDSKAGPTFAMGPTMNMGWYLLFFVLFTAFDIMNLVVAPSLWSALPVLVHGVFLPPLIYTIYQQRKGNFPPSKIIQFIELLITYMIVYVVTEVIVAAIFGDVLAIGIDIFIGVCMVMMWRRVLQQMKFIFRGQL